jgi:hypothetical protein
VPDSIDAAGLCMRLAHSIFAIHAITHLVLDGVMKISPQLFLSHAMARFLTTERPQNLE